MRFLIVTILFFTYVYADLQSKINTSAQMACFLKNPTNGLGATDYSPVIIGQTLRQSIESLHTSTQSEVTCDDWLLDPYVNIDTETYQVIANMDCSVNSEQVTYGDSSTTYYWTVINQYALDIDCQASCEVPRDSNGNIYDFTPYISEVDCTTPNLQQLLLAEDPNSLYTIVDTQYLNCTTNSNLTGCFYLKTINFDGNTDINSTDSNSTDDNSTVDNNTTLSNVDLTATNSILDDIGTKIDSNGEKIDTLGTKLDDLGTKIDSNGQKIDNLGTKIDVNGVKIDAVRDSVIGTGNYLGVKIDSMNESITNELKFQGDRLHSDLEALIAKPTAPDINISNNFDDTGIIEAIRKNTDAIKEMNDLNDSEFNFDKYKEYFDDVVQSVADVENNVNDLMATIQGDYVPDFQSHSSCVINFNLMGVAKSIDMCRYSSMLRPYIVFILTIYFLLFLIRLHIFFLFKLFRSTD